MREYLDYLQQIMCKGHYLSFYYKLSVPVQKQYAESSQNFEFMWNYYMMLPLITRKVSRQWIVQVIQGYVGKIQHRLAPAPGAQSGSSHCIDYVLISRRVTRQAGVKQRYKGSHSPLFLSRPPSRFCSPTDSPPSCIPPRADLEGRTLISFHP